MMRLTEQDLVSIEEMYYEQNKQAGDIAALFGVDRTSIQRALKKRDPERYLAFKSASGKSNKKENKSAVEWESLSAEWLALYHKGWKLKKIAKKYGYDATHVSNIMKKYQKQKFGVLKEERKAENLRRKEDNTKEDAIVEAGMKKQQEQNAREMSHRGILSDYAMFMMYLHLYQRYEAGVYRLKYKIRNQMPADMPKVMIYNPERDCARYLKKTS